MSTTTHNGARQLIIGGIICAVGLGLHGAATGTTGWTRRTNILVDGVTAEIGIFKVCVNQVCVSYQDPEYTVRLVQGACIVAIILAAIGLSFSFMHVNRRWHGKPECAWMQRIGFTFPLLAACFIAAAVSIWGGSIKPRLYEGFELHYSFYMCCAGGGILIIGGCVIFKSAPAASLSTQQQPPPGVLAYQSPTMGQAYPMNPPPYNQQYPPPVSSQIYSVGYYQDTDIRFKK